jgi:predicted RNA-binding Zn-ribbon protein involved in translation (DUF1610 family)
MSVSCNQCGGTWDDGDVTIHEIVDISYCMPNREEVRFTCPTCGIEIIHQRDKAA